MFIADLHLHTQYSDGVLTIRELVDLMGAHGVGAIAITDHLCESKSFLGKSARFLDKSLTEKTFARYLAEIKTEAAYAWEKYQMLVIPGVEITKNSFSHKNSAHILAIGITEYISPDLPIEATLTEIRRQGALSVAAHPVHTGAVEHQTYQLWNHKETLAPLFDAWEVASGPVLFKEVLHSGLPMLANSDLHHPKQLASWKNIFQTEKNWESLKEAVIKQDVTFEFVSPGLSSRRSHAPAQWKPARSY